MMLVLQLETILTHLLYDVLSNRELLRRAIGDNGPHTLQAQQQSNETDDYRLPSVVC